MPQPQPLPAADKLVECWSCGYLIRVLATTCSECGVSQPTSSAQLNAMRFVRVSVYAGLTVSVLMFTIILLTLLLVAGSETKLISILYCCCGAATTVMLYAHAIAHRTVVSQYKLKYCLLIGCPMAWVSLLLWIAALLHLGSRGPQLLLAAACGTLAAILIGVAMVFTAPVRRLLDRIWSVRFRTAYLAAKLVSFIGGTLFLVSMFAGGIYSLWGEADASKVAWWLYRVSHSVFLISGICYLVAAVVAQQLGTEDERSHH